jgi:hypothetical protein
MKPEPLCHLFAKTERAEAQINDLNERIKAFFKATPYEIASNLNEDGTLECTS